MTHPARSEKIEEALREVMELLDETGGSDCDEDSQADVIFKRARRILATPSAVGAPAVEGQPLKEALELMEGFRALANGELIACEAGEPSEKCRKRLYHEYLGRATALNDGINAPAPIPLAEEPGILLTNWKPLDPIGPIPPAPVAPEWQEIENKIQWLIEAAGRYKLAANLHNQVQVGKAEVELKQLITRYGKDGERWNALLNCARIRILGTAGLTLEGERREDRKDVHFGAEFWTHHNAERNERIDAYSKTVLTSFADAALSGNGEEA